MKNWMFQFVLFLFSRHISPGYKVWASFECALRLLVRSPNREMIWLERLESRSSIWQNAWRLEKSLSNIRLVGVISTRLSCNVVRIERGWRCYVLFRLVGDDPFKAHGRSTMYFLFNSLSLPQRGKRRSPYNIHFHTYLRPTILGSFESFARAESVIVARFPISI